MFSRIPHPSDTRKRSHHLKLRRNSSPPGRRTLEGPTLGPCTVPRPSGLGILVLLLPGETEWRRICRPRHFPSSPLGARMNFKISCQVSVVQMLNSWQGPRMCSLRYQGKLSRAQALAGARSQSPVRTRWARRVVHTGNTVHGSDTQGVKQSKSLTFPGLPSRCALLPKGVRLLINVVLAPHERGRQSRSIPSRDPICHRPRRRRRRKRKPSGTRAGRRARPRTPRSPLQGSPGPSSRRSPLRFRNRREAKRRDALQQDLVCMNAAYFPEKSV